MSAINDAVAKATEMCTRTVRALTRPVVEQAFGEEGMVFVNRFVERGAELKQSLMLLAAMRYFENPSVASGLIRSKLRSGSEILNATGIKIVCKRLKDAAGRNEKNVPLPHSQIDTAFEGIHSNTRYWKVPGGRKRNIHAGPSPTDRLESHYRRISRTDVGAWEQRG